MNKKNNKVDKKLEAKDIKKTEVKKTISFILYNKQKSL